MTALYGPEFFVGRSHTVAISAQAVTPVLHDLFAPSSVLDVGCGHGEWLEAFDLDDVFGVDLAAPYGPRFLRHDLRKPLNLGRTFDLVVSLETGEHLPEDAAGTLVDSIVRHGSCVVFSAAVVGQEGIGHINCQPHEYWHEKFEDYGFVTYDAIRPQIAGDSRVSWWYAQNIFLYARN